MAFHLDLEVDAEESDTELQQEVEKHGVHLRNYLPVGVAIVAKGK